MEIQKIPAEKLKAAKYNPRKNLKPGDPEYEKLRRSIEEFGYVEPVIWNRRTGNIVGGHQRYKVLTALGIKEIDCVVVDMDEEREKALNVALNKVGGDWDVPLLTDLLKDLESSGFDVSLTGFDAAELDELFGNTNTGKVKEDDFDVDKAAAEIIEPVSRRGDIWLLGRHRLM
ncbi:MAG: ParB N-terminal domain-containing protein, partial [Clostridiales bacterium]|nr:ParB N-terminal domain-containing protein [Clostridiales bacterium]